MFIIYQYVNISSKNDRFIFSKTEKGYYRTCEELTKLNENFATGIIALE